MYKKALLALWVSIGLSTAACSTSDNRTPGFMTVSASNYYELEPDHNGWMILSCKERVIGGFAPLDGMGAPIVAKEFSVAGKNYALASTSVYYPFADKTRVRFILNSNAAADVGSQAVVLLKNSGGGPGELFEASSDENGNATATATIELGNGSANRFDYDKLQIQFANGQWTEIDLRFEGIEAAIERKCG